ncbi:hypothetical protein BJX65DRAFT_270601 [Aspergillus insuetus]
MYSRIVSLTLRPSPLLYCFNIASCLSGRASQIENLTTLILGAAYTTEAKAYARSTVATMQSTCAFRPFRC